MYQGGHAEADERALLIVGDRRATAEAHRERVVAHIGRVVTAGRRVGTVVLVNAFPGI